MGPVGRSAASYPRHGDWEGTADAGLALHIQAWHSCQELVGNRAAREGAPVRRLLVAATAGRLVGTPSLKKPCPRWAKSRSQPSPPKGPPHAHGLHDLADTNGQQDPLAHSTTPPPSMPTASSPNGGSRHWQTATWSAREGDPSAHRSPRLALEGQARRSGR